MSKVAISEEYLTDIADSIREKLNSQDTYKVSEMSEAIDSIETGGGGTDWSIIGYENEPEGFTMTMNYAKDIYDNWDNSASSYGSKFSGDKSLNIMPNVDTSRASLFNAMFYNATALKIVPPLNTSNGTTFNQMFSGCTALETIPELDFSNATRIDTLLSSTSSLKKLGGFKNLGQSYSKTQSANYNRYKLDVSANIDHDSLMNIINKVYDIATRGCNTQTLSFGSTNLAKLTAQEIAIATNKGWTVS